MTRERSRIFHCTFLPACRPLRPGKFQHRYVPELGCRHGLRRLTTGSALPKFPQSVRAGLRHFVASLVRFRYGLPGCSPPVRIRLDRPAFGDFYFQAFNGSVSLSVAGYNYNSGWISFCWRDLHPLEWQLASLHGQKAKYSLRADISALLSAADMRWHHRHDRFVPFATKRAQHDRRKQKDRLARRSFFNVDY